MAAEDNIEDRWVLHSARQVEASKSGALAITLLNSGSWLALLSQIGSLQGYSIGWSVLTWGTGALLGTSLWLFIYRGALLSWKHEMDRQDQGTSDTLEKNILIGVTVAISALLCFAAGVVMLAISLL